MPVVGFAVVNTCWHLGIALRDALLVIGNPTGDAPLQRVQMLHAADAQLRDRLIWSSSL